MILLLPLQFFASKPPTRPLQKTDAAHGKYVVSAGKGFMPFLKQCSTCFFKRLGHFLWKGMKPFPAQGTCDPSLGVYVEEFIID